MMFYSQDHWGYAFYPSDVAVRHPHLHQDIFGTEVSLARKLGMSVVCYYSLQFNNQGRVRFTERFNKFLDRNLHTHL
jgi:hypothetical protein